MTFEFFNIWDNNALLSLPRTTTNTFSFLDLSAGQRSLEGPQCQNIRVGRGGDKIEANPPPIELLLEKRDEVGNVGKGVIFLLNLTTKYIHKTHEAGNYMFVSFVFIGFGALLIILSHEADKKSKK